MIPFHILFHKKFLFLKNKFLKIKIFSNFIKNFKIDLKSDERKTQENIKKKCFNKNF